MSTDRDAFLQWLDEARIPRTKRSPRRLVMSQSLIAFLRQAERDYTSRRLVTHFLLNCQLGLKLAQVARLVNMPRPIFSPQMVLSTPSLLLRVLRNTDGQNLVFQRRFSPRLACAVHPFSLLCTFARASRKGRAKTRKRNGRGRVSARGANPPPVRLYPRRFGLRARPAPRSARFFHLPMGLDEYLQRLGWSGRVVVVA